MAAGMLARVQCVGCGGQGMGPGMGGGGGMGAGGDGKGGEDTGGCRR